MAIDNLELRIQKAKSLGYTNAQIQTYLGSQGVTAKPDGTGKDYLKGVGKSVLQTTYSASAFNAGPVGKHMLDGAPELKNKISGVKEWLEPKTMAEQVGNVTGDIIQGIVPVKIGATIAGRVATRAADSVVTGGANLAESAAKTVGKIAEQPIAKNVETVLKETPVDVFDNYVTLATKAAENNKNITPMEFVGKRAEAALDQIQRKLDTIGGNKRVITDSAVGRQPVGNIVVKFRQNLINAYKGQAKVDGDDKLIEKLITRSEELGNNPSAQQVDMFIDAVQDEIYTANRNLTIPVTDKTTAAIRSITGKLNDALKSKLPSSYSNLNDEYSRLVKVRDELNLKLGKEGEKGGALMKRIFSPSDANMKELAAQIHEITGIDLTNEATVARYTMDVLGDVRQKSMLKELDDIKSTNIVGQIVNYIMEHFNSPEEIIKRARSRTIGGSGV
jgi:hypothetical protein